MIRAFIFTCVATGLAAMPSFALAQYSKNATVAAQQGIFIYRPVTPSGNLQIQPRAGFSIESQRGVFIYPIGPTGNLTVPQRPIVAPNQPSQISNQTLRPSQLSNQTLLPSQISNQPVALFVPKGKTQSNAFVDRVNSNAIVVNSGGQLFAVKPDADATIQVVGMATRDFLKPGQLVKFTGKFDDENKSLAPLDQLAVVSLRAGDKAGAKPLTDDDLPAPRSGTDATSNAPTSLAVLGRINSILGNTMTVGTGTDTFKVDVDSNVKVNLNTSDFSIAQPGDKIAVTGIISKAGIAQAKEIKITLAKRARAKRAANP